MPPGLLYHSAVFICSACHSFPSAWSFYARNPRHLCSAGLRSHGTQGRLSDKETVNAGQNSCVLQTSTISWDSARGDPSAYLRVKIFQDSILFVKRLTGIKTHVKPINCFLVKGLLICKCANIHSPNRVTCLIVPGVTTIDEHINVLSGNTAVL